MAFPSVTDIPLNVPAWVDCGVVVTPAQALFYTAVGTGFLGASNGSRPCNPGGAVPYIPLVGNAAIYGYYPAYISASVAAAGYGALAVALKADGTGPPSTWSGGGFPGWDGSTSPITYGFCPGNNTPLSYVNPLGVNARVWAVMQVTGGEPYNHDVTGGPYVLTITDALFVLPMPVVTACADCCKPVVTVTWTQVFTVGTPDHVAATSYTLSRQVNGGGYATIGTVAGTVFSYRDTNLSIHDTVDYQVTATYLTTTSMAGTASAIVRGVTRDADPTTTATRDADTVPTATRDPDCGC